MTWLISMLGGKLAVFLGAAGAAILAIIGIRWDAKRDERKDSEIAALKANEKTRKDIEDAVEKSAAGGGLHWTQRLRDSADD